MMDVISNGPWKRRVIESLGMKESESSGRAGDVFGKEFWKQIMELFGDEVEDGVVSFDFLAYILLRILAAIISIPMWILLGIVSFGWFWPPQVRVAVFTSTVFKHSSDSEKEDELRKTQMCLDAWTVVRGVRMTDCLLFLFPPLAK
jgi:hypothetical protein